MKTEPMHLKQNSQTIHSRKLNTFKISSLGFIEPKRLMITMMTRVSITFSITATDDGIRGLCPERAKNSQMVKPKHELAHRLNRWQQEGLIN